MTTSHHHFKKKIDWCSIFLRIDAKV